MAWRRPGYKPLSEPMVVSSLTHICVTRPQWVKTQESFAWKLHFPLLVDDRNSWMRQVDMFIEVNTYTIYCVVVAEYFAKEGIPRTFLRIIYHQFVPIWGELGDHWQKSSIKSRDTLCRFFILWGHPHHTDAIINAFYGIYVATFLNFITKTNLVNIFGTIYRATNWICNRYGIFNLHMDHKMITMQNGNFLYLGDQSVSNIINDTDNPKPIFNYEIVVNSFLKVQSFNLFFINDTNRFILFPTLCKQWLSTWCYQAIA